jgi:RNA polymerase sigma-70 factor (ECF subfamily)
MVAEHEKALLRYATRLLNDAAAAEDVVQNVFIKLFRRGPSAIPPPEQIKCWLFRVTHNEAIDHLRREQRLRMLHERHLESQTDERAGAGCADMSLDEKRELVLQLLGRLRPRERQVLLLRLDSGLSYEEIAAATGRSVGNVGNLLHHAVKNMARLLADRGALGRTRNLEHAR